MKNEGDTDLIESNDLELGSMRGISPENAFVLGVEWQMFREQLRSGRPFTKLCVSANVERLVKMAEKEHRFVEDRPTLWRGWSEIWVGDHIS